jgi:hypothetical protein
MKSSMGLVLLAFLLLISGSVAVAAETNPPTIELSKAVHFLTSSGDDVVVGPGTFEVDAVEKGLRLTPKEGKPEDAKVIQAEPLPAQEPSEAGAQPPSKPIKGPQALAQEIGDDALLVAFVQADGLGLQTIGSYSGIQDRGAPTVSIANPVKGQIISGEYRIRLQSSSQGIHLVRKPLSLVVMGPPVPGGISCPPPKVRRVLFSSFQYYEFPMECTWKSLEVPDGPQTLWGWIVFPINCNYTAVDRALIPCTGGNFVDFNKVDVVVRNRPVRPITPPTAPPTTISPPTGGIFHASTDFSGVQGPRWFYQDSQGRPMTFNSAQNFWQGVEQYLLLTRNGGHPGNGADAVRLWSAPSAGTVRITGSVSDGNASCGGGVTVSVRKGGTVLWQQALANGNTAGVSFNVSTSVTSGTAIDFVINQGADGNNSCDSTTFDPTITYVP